MGRARRRQVVGIASEQREEEVCLNCNDVPSAAAAATTTVVVAVRKKERGFFVRRFGLCSFLFVLVIFIVIAIRTVPREPVLIEVALAEFADWVEKKIPVWNATVPWTVERHLREHKVEAVFPVLIIPGLVSTQLEVWKSLPCARDNFRSTVWGGFDMIKAFIRNKTCWMEHLALDEETGLDPFGGKIKMRAAEGFASADYLFPGYWVWSRVIKVLGTIGADPRNLAIHPWDWRPSFQKLEERDRSLSKLKRRVEEQFEFNDNKKVVLVSHSVGSLLVFYFMKWVTFFYDPMWVDKYVKSWVNISGALLGVNKAIACLVSGEMKDLNIFGAAARYMIDQLLPMEDRVRLWRSMGTMRHMIPKGGARVWGHLSEPTLFNFPENISMNLNMDDFLKWSREHIDADYFNDWLDHDTHLKMPSGTAPFPDVVTEKDYKYWLNPLASPLPYAPSLRIYCVYGHGIPTERSYLYQRNNQSSANGESTASSAAPFGVGAKKRKPVHLPVKMVPPHLHGSPENLWKWPELSKNEKANTQAHGPIVLGDGDTTVPLESLGLMCQLWKTKRYNPSGAKVRVKEIYHNTSAFQDLLRDSRSAQHVDIMGNSEMLELLARVAGGQDPEEESHSSLIKELAKRVIDSEFE